jgi:hypothetical protein
VLELSPQGANFFDSRSSSDAHKSGKRVGPTLRNPCRWGKPLSSLYGPLIEIDRFGERLIVSW